jgi:hypothetical protein
MTLGRVYQENGAQIQHLETNFKTIVKINAQISESSLGCLLILILPNPHCHPV